VADLGAGVTEGENEPDRSPYRLMQVVGRLLGSCDRVIPSGKKAMHLSD
jgi:hypothetical protein